MSSPIDPYPGLAPFRDRDEDRKLFSGRDDEKERLLALVLAERLTVLFGRSGIGKTSLLQAGLMEDLRTRGFFPVVTRLTYDREGGPVRSVIESITSEAHKNDVAIQGGDETPTLWQWFRNVSFSKGGKRLRPVLVMDQFEELFTAVRSAGHWEGEFIRQLSDLVRGRPPAEVAAAAVKRIDALDEDSPERKELVAMLYENPAPDVRIVAAIREDYLPELETLKTYIPTIFQHSLRLEPLSIEQARLAIVNPGQQKEVVGESFTISPDAITEILTFLRTRRVGQRVIEGSTIEPVQLQILCRYLNAERRRKGASEISSDLLKGRRGMQGAIRGHYLDVLQQFPLFRAGWSARRLRPGLTNWVMLSRPRAAVATLCERGLITASGHRNSLPGVIVERSFGVTKTDLATLVSSRILSVEARLGSQFYELIHDTLLAPLKHLDRARLNRRGAIAVGLVAALALAFPAVRDWYDHKRPCRRSHLRQISAAPFETLVGRGTRNFKFAQLNGLEARGVQTIGTNSSRLTSPRHIWIIHTSSMGPSPERAFPGPDFKEAALVGTDFAGSDLRDANLTDADLRNANFSDAVLEGAVLTAADVAGAKFESQRTFKAARSTAWRGGSRRVD